MWPNDITPLQSTVCGTHRYEGRWMHFRNSWKTDQHWSRWWLNHPSETYSSNWIISPIFGVRQKYLKPPSSDSDQSPLGGVKISRIASLVTLVAQQNPPWNICCGALSHWCSLHWKCVSSNLALTGVAFGTHCQQQPKLNFDFQLD